MDTLALLCNLHADGPATLQRLRRSGCESLASLRRLDASALALRLDWNERAAERFLREAALLSERVEDELPAVREAELERAELQDDGLDDDPDDAAEEPEDDAETFELESTLVAELAGDPSEAEPEDDDEGFEDADDDEEEDEGGYAPSPERVQAVLGAWRELDRVAPPSDPDEFEIPRPVREATPDRALVEVELAGLSPRLCARLVELGVHSLRELVEARELELARAVPLAFTRLKHLQFLAARVLESLPRSEPAPFAAEPQPRAGTPAPARSFQTFVPPPSEPFETAGPFA